MGEPYFERVDIGLNSEYQNILLDYFILNSQELIECGRKEIHGNLFEFEMRLNNMGKDMVLKTRWEVTDNFLEYLNKKESEIQREVS